MESQSKSLFVGYLRGIRVLKKQYDGSKQLRHGQYKKREGCWIPFLQLPVSAPEATFAHLFHCNKPELSGAAPLWFKDNLPSN